MSAYEAIKQNILSNKYPFLEYKNLLDNRYYNLCYNPYYNVYYNPYYIVSYIHITMGIAIKRNITRITIRIITKKYNNSNKECGI